jgi:flavin reductase (DIM6/NTAB) family NADH-FMN oxidoreductase RutF
VNAFSEIFEQLNRELWVITARAGERCSGLVATYISRASLVPELPRVTIAIAKHHYTHDLIESSNAFCMHLISEDQLDWVWRFGIPSGRETDKLCGLAMTTSVSGSPILTGALAWLDCRIEARMNTGDRTVYLAEVLDARSRIEGTGGGDLRSGAVWGPETRAQPGTPLTFKRMLEIAPAARLQEMKQSLNSDMELDRAAILNWRRALAASDREGE